MAAVFVCWGGVTGAWIQKNDLKFLGLGFKRYICNHKKSSCMSLQSRIVAFMVLLILCLSVHFATWAVPSNATPKSDGTLMSYFRDCQTHIGRPEAIAMCDTLFLRAQAVGDQRLQAMALYARLDCYYALNAASSQIAEATKQIQRFCRSHSWPEFIRDYYSVSTHRLIPYYIQHNQANAAVYETCQLLTEAKGDHYPLGVASCYRILAEIYFSQADFQQAYVNYGLAIEQIAHHNITEIPLSTQYAKRAECALALNMPDSAALLMRQGWKCVTQGASVLGMERLSLLYNLHIGDLAAAGEVIARTENLFAEQKSLAPYVAELFAMQTAYYMATQQYALALTSALAVWNDSTHQISSKMREEALKYLGDIYYRLGNQPQALNYYRRYVTTIDSLRQRELHLAANDLSGILEVVRLQNETKGLQFDIQQRRLRNTYLTIVSLLSILAITVIITVRTIRIYRQLKLSESRVVMQNAELKLQGEALMRAKVEAEKASCMKSDFIQSMSHEVRTPLNSIVGFSQVLASQFRRDASTVEYAAIIESSSLNLLRLIDDVLDIAALDQIEELAHTDICELNSSCSDCADKILPQLNPGVALVLEVSAENPRVYTNLRRVKQVLMHLLHNAAKFTSSGQVLLNYTCLPDQQRLRFTVSDTGPGIPPEQRQVVFERFVKLDDFAQGTGLGLSVCRIITEKMGGTLRIDDSYAPGCSFIFEIPFNPAENKTTAV